MTTITTTTHKPSLPPAATCAEAGHRRAVPDQRHAQPPAAVQTHHQSQATRVHAGLQGSICQRGAAPISDGSHARRACSAHAGAARGL